MDNTVQPTSPAPEENKITTVEDKTPAQTEENAIQNHTAFKPSDKQMEWLRAGFEIGSSSPSKIAKHLERESRTFYLWYNDADFMAWWAKEWEKYYAITTYQMLSLKSRTLEAMVVHAEKGNHDYLKDALVVLGIESPPRPVAEVGKPQTLIQVIGNALAKSEQDAGAEVKEEKKDGE